MSAHVEKGGALTSTSDTVDADALPSAPVAVNGGAGAYRVLVTKAGEGAKNYTLSFHCQTGPDGTGSHAGTTSSLLQDQ